MKVFGNNQNYCRCDSAIIIYVAKINDILVCCVISLNPSQSSYVDAKQLAISEA